MIKKLPCEFYYRNLRPDEFKFVDDYNQALIEHGASHWEGIALRSDFDSEGELQAIPIGTVWLQFSQIILDINPEYKTLPRK